MQLSKCLSHTGIGIAYIFNPLKSTFLYIIVNYFKHVHDFLLAITKPQKVNTLFGK